jgi:inner membrane protein
MASAFGHACAALTIGKVYSGKKLPVLFWALTIICSIIPDADIIGFKFHIAYGSMFGHRGFTHSILFALVMGFIAAWILTRSLSIDKKQFWKFVIYFFLITLSHPLLDACTNGGLGVAFFSPFSNHRYFFPDFFRRIQVSPIKVDSFFSDWGLRVLLSEFIWIGLPSIVIIFATYFIRKRKNAKTY